MSHKSIKKKHTKITLSELDEKAPNKLLGFQGPTMALGKFDKKENLYTPISIANFFIF